ncbi:MAG: DNA sulfur modification protein DndD [Rubrivivax sp.]
MSKVTFLSIGIENIGPFREQQTLDLSVKYRLPVVLVKALNGSGKTTLLTCLQVVLYGSKALPGVRASEYEQLIRSLLRADAEGPARIVLTLQIDVNGERDQLDVTREWNVTPMRFSERLTVGREGSPDFQLTQEWDDYLDGILPCELLHLFLFDGEKIEALANPKTLPDMLRRATEAFLGIGGIDSLTKDLVAVERRALLQSKEDGGDFDRAREELSAMEAALVEAENKIQILRQSAAHADQLVESHRKAYERFAAEAQRSGLAVYERAAEIGAAEKVARRRLEEASEEVRSALADPLLPLSRLGELWDRYKSQWAGEADARTSRQLVEVIEGRDARVLKQMAKELPAKSLGALQQLLMEDVSRYRDAASRPIHLLPAPAPETLEPQIAAARARHRTALDRLEERKSELADLERQVAAIPKGEQLADLLSRLQSKATAVTEAEVHLAALRQQLTDHEGSAAHTRLRIDSARERMTKDFQGQALDTRALEAGQRARAVLATFKERLLASKAAWLSEMITAEFKSLMRKQRLVSRVNVDPSSYAVTIMGGNGHELPMERLSAGERQLLAIAVLSALIRKRKGRFPVVVDTPLARLDRSHREALVKHFFAKVSHQVMVLSTDEEVEGNVFREMSRYTSHSYVIEFSDAERRSLVADLSPEQEFVQP